MKILLAEDEIQMNRVVSTALAHEGYEVDSAFDGQEAVDLASQNAYDVMVMDIMMPKMTGLEAVRAIRQSGSQAHIIMLTAMGEVDDRVTGLDAGADDYLTKPFSLKELLARLRSMARRVDTSFTSNVLTLGQTQLNVAEQELASHNTIRLSGAEAKLLEFFMLNPNKNLTVDRIFDHLWGKEGQEDFDRADVYIYVSYLRQKLLAVGSKLVISGDQEQGFRLESEG